jgi:hypothetical protein
MPTLMGHLRILILLDNHSYQCVCVLHAILLPLGHLTLLTIAPYNYPKIIRPLQKDNPG